MTITVAPARNEYTSNAGQTIFNFTFKIFSVTDLNVYITPSGQDADDSTDITIAYVVAPSGLNNEDGGIITFTSGVSLNDLVTIVSNVPSSRTVDYQNNGDFRPDTVNTDFDTVVSIVKKIEDDTNRSLLLPQAQQGPKPLSLPNPISQAIMRWKSDLTGLENTFVSELAPGVFPNDEFTLQGTLAGKRVDTTVLAGQVYMLSDRANGIFDVISGTGTATGFDIIAHDTLSLSFELRDKSSSTPKQWGAIGKKLDHDDTLNLQAFFDYFKSVNAAQPNTVPTFQLDVGLVYYVTSQLIVENCGIIGNGSVFFTDQDIGILRTVGSGNIYQDFVCRYDVSTSAVEREAITFANFPATNEQNAKNIWTNVVVRNPYRGFVWAGGAGSQGGTAACTFEHCRVDFNWDWGFFADCSTGTTTLTMINCQQFGSLPQGSTQIKGFFFNNCAEVSLVGTTSMDQVSDGLALQITGAKTVTIDQIVLESCEMTSAGSRMIDINGADVIIGTVSAKVCLFDMGVGNEGYLVQVGSTTKSIEINSIQQTNDQAGATGTLFHGRSGTGVPIKVNNTSLDLWQVNGLYSTFYNNGDTQGYSNNFANTGTAGVARRQLINRDPEPGEATHWIDDGTDYQVGAVILGGEVTTATTVQFTDISHAVNTEGKWLGKVLPDTTTGLTMMALGATAAHQWRPSDNSGDITPV